MRRADPSTTRTFDAMGTLLLADRRPSSQHPFAQQWFERELEYVLGLNETAFWDFLQQAQTQRVLQRIVAVLKNYRARTNQSHIAERLELVLSEDRKRVETATVFLRAIVDRFEQGGHPIVIMKTLDHWPDTGSDLDLLVTAPEETVRRVFASEFGAQQQPPSWGDRLANKFNFRVPGLAELVEVHVGCLGQTGEQKSLARRVLIRRTYNAFGSDSFPVPIVEDRVVISTMQRMYRHFYIRLTDIVNLFGLLAQGRVDFDRLQVIAEDGAIWPGVATLLVIVRQHGLRFGNSSVELPESVSTAARFNSRRTYLGQKFVRVPIIPEAANLFLRQLVGNGRRHDFEAMMRLALVPALVTAAFLSFRLTGDDKGVW